MIAVDGLRYSYPGATGPAIEDIAFTADRGEIVGLLGPTGAGKTTIQRVLARLNRGYEGEVTVLGRSLSDWDQRYFQQIGVGFEEPTHYLRLSPRENLDLFAALYDRPTRPVGDLIDELDLGAVADQPVRNLSKGAMVRLGLARALLHDPEILILDEPTGGLDPVSAGRVRRLLAARRSRGAIVIATQDMRDVEALCDRVVFLVAGRQVACDSPASLRAHYGRPSVIVEFLYEDTVLSEEFPLDGLADNAAFLDILRDGAVRSIHSQEAGLDRVFREATGAELGPPE